MVYIKINIYDYMKRLLCVAYDGSLSEEILIVKTEKTTIFRKWQKVKVELLSDKGAQWVEGFVRMIIDDMQINIALTRIVDVEERREHVKVPCRLESEIREFMVDDSLLVMQEPVPIIVRNISVGGMMFSAPACFPLGMQGKFEFKAGTHPITLKYTVVRVEDYSAEDAEKPLEESYDYRYGCQFGALTDEMDAILCGYVYQVDLQRRKAKQKEKYHPYFDDDDE